MPRCRAKAQRYEKRPVQGYQKDPFGEQCQKCQPFP